VDEETRAAIERLDRSVREEIATSAAETRRHFDVVAESLRGDIRTLTEAVAVSNETMGRRLAEHDTRSERLEGRVVHLEARVSILEDAARPRRRRRR
jgi:hypothetical protein